MGLETAIKFLILFAQICAVCTVGAIVADHIVQPVINRRRTRRAP